MENLKGLNVKIDFSGGDPLSVTSTIVVMKKAREFFGKENITLTATGAGLSRIKVDQLMPIIGELNFTYDSSGKVANVTRPTGYAFSNLKKASQFSKAGIKTRAETPLNTENVDKKSLTRIYLDLHEANISTHLIMRLFPSGRGVLLKSKIPTAEQYKIALDLLYELENKYEYPKIKLQCALKFLDSRKNFERNPCDLITNSFGLMPNGTLIASPWAINNIGQPINDLFVLGNLSKTKMSDILLTEKVRKFIKRADENFGHCKIHSFFNSENKEEGLYEKHDPLYLT